jgi:hypothetical protein
MVILVPEFLRTFITRQGFSPGMNHAIKVGYLVTIFGMPLTSIGFGVWALVRNGRQGRVDALVMALLGIAVSVLLFIGLVM